MCGIVGYVGKREATPLLMEGLRRLEYRGYDSAGVCILADGKLHVRKQVGRVEGLAQSLKAMPVRGTLGISHNRWATHGLPSDINSHPHLDESGKMAMVHNGIIENYASLRHRLQRHGHHFARRPRDRRGLDQGLRACTESEGWTVFDRPSGVKWRACALLLSILPT